MTKHITVALTEDQEAHFRAQAERQDVSLEAVIAEVIQGRIEYDAWFAQEVQKGIEAIERGEFFTHEEVVARSKVRRAELIAKYGEP